MKRLFDLALGLFAAAVLVLPVLIVAILVRLTSPGPALYWSDRVGRRNAIFKMPKFRSMRIGTPAVATHLLQDPKVYLTPIGSFLRKSSLDELPQLFNVLRGDMSLIGPRPERPEFVAVLTEQLPYYDMRHAVRPGLTGWAQVRYRYGSSVQDALVKLQYDLYYIKHRGPFLDILILLHTLRTVLRMEGT